MYCVKKSGVRTIGDLIRLSPLLIDEDDGHQDDDLGHNAKEGPEGSQAAADTQVDLVGVCAKLIGSRARVVTNVVFDAQIINSQNSLVRGALDLIFVGSAIEDGLRVMLKQQVSNASCIIINLFFNFELKHRKYIIINLSTPVY